MRNLPLKANHKRVAAYHASLEEFGKLGVKHETAVRAAFQALLEDCTSLVNKGRADKWKLVTEFSLKTKAGAKITPDGTLLDSFRLMHGFWEAKDSADDLDKEITKKFKLGYPRDNILFQTPTRAILIQDGEKALDLDISKPENLVTVLKGFFEYQAPAFDEWELAVAEFKNRLPEIGKQMTEIIRAEKKVNKKFSQAFADFLALCHQALNPNLAVAAVEEMLIQHILTERIFRKIFDVGEFMQRNNIAAEIEKVVIALTSRSFSRDKFLKELDRFYVAIEAAADTIPDFSEKQKFLNTVYEQFFQGFAVKRADTLGIVYTPQEIVDFMLASVEEILNTEFKRSLGDTGVHVIDPFVGTGNFMVNLIRRLPKTRLEHKYRHELHCNEVMLLPYYVAAMNIEHTFWEQTGHFESFPGICLVDTFETAEKAQDEFGFFNPENSERVKRQKNSPIFVVMGNPPYNGNQVNENDNNKNRKYEAVDDRVRITYTRDSKATLHNKLSGDPYVKAYRWATDRLGEEGVLAYVSNNSFIDDRQFDGMRKHLAGDFDALYILDLGGDVQQNPEYAGTTHNVFGIKVGVSINILVRGGTKAQRPGTVYYHAIPLFWKREEKLQFIAAHSNHKSIEWKTVIPDKRNSWLTEGELSEFDDLVPIGVPKKDRPAIQSGCMIFLDYSLGISTNRDDTVYAFNSDDALRKVAIFSDSYNTELERFKKKGCPKDLDSFVDYDALKWSRNLKRHFADLDTITHHAEAIKTCVYRPYTAKALYLADIAVDEPAATGSYFPNETATRENRLLSLTGPGSQKPFLTIVTNYPVDLHFVGAASSTFCFPFYTYDANDGSRHENILDSTLIRFQKHYGDKKISKWDIFHYVYAMLHNPEYRTRYAANLRRELPRLPLIGTDASAFHAFAVCGKKLADLHVHYEQAAEFPLQRIENPDEPLNWTAEKMRLSKDKNSLTYNSFLTLSGIPQAAYTYRLGNRSALEWVIDQYQTSTDARSGITNDPNREDEPDYIVNLIGKVITVSLETQKLIAALPGL